MSHPEIELRLSPQRESSSPVANIARDLALYMVNSLSERHAEIEGDELVARVECDSVFPEVRERIFELSEEEAPAVIAGLRGVLKLGIYDRTQRRRNPEIVLPETLGELEEKTHFLGWPEQVIEKSKMKNHPRVIRRSESMSISQTMVDGKVRETEIILKRSTGGDWDFYTYDQSGHRSLESTFANIRGNEVRGASPYTCLTCHYNPESRTFGRAAFSFRR